MKNPSRSTTHQPEDRREVPVAPSNIGAIPAKWQRHYCKLQELRDTLVAQNRGLLNDAREPVVTAGSHPAESGTDEFDRGLHLSLLGTEQNALHEVEAALRRIETGAYGICAISGKPIPAARLKAVPWTRYTAPVEAELELARHKQPDDSHNGRNRAARRIALRAVKSHSSTSRKNGQIG